MKKFLLTLTVGLMLMVNPVSADAPFKLVVDNKPIDKPIVLIDSSAYVPIRAVADIFKADVDWNYQTKTISIIPKAIDPRRSSGLLSRVIRSLSRRSPRPWTCWSRRTFRITGWCVRMSG